jgi:L-iditol 2-dehydrogenase
MRRGGSHHGAAIETIAKGGTIIVVGVFGEKPRLDMGLVQDRELNLHGTLMYKREDYERAVELIRVGPDHHRTVDVSPFPHGRLPGGV